MSGDNEFDDAWDALMSADDPDPGEPPRKMVRRYGDISINVEVPEPCDFDAMERTRQTLLAAVSAAGLTKTSEGSSYSEWPADLDDSLPTANVHGSSVNVMSGEIEMRQIVLGEGLRMRLDVRIDADRRGAKDKADQILAVLAANGIEVLAWEGIDETAPGGFEELSNQ